MDGLSSNLTIAGIDAVGVSKVIILGRGTIRNYIYGVHFQTVSDSEVQKVTVVNPNGFGVSLNLSTARRSRT